MKTKAFLLAGALTFALSGAASAGGLPTASSPPPKPAGKFGGGQMQSPEKQSAALCIKQECVITVTVDKCVVTVDPYFIVMTGKAPVKMVWQIKGNGSFASDAIRWKEAAGRAVFKRTKVGEKEAVFENSRKNGIYHYGVTVKEGDKTCPELDPTGINDM